MIPVEMTGSTGSTCQCGSQITEETIRNIVRKELENQK